MEAPSRQQLRTRETQKRLLDAAEEVFVRDGYEAAQLDAIAAAAGRSKGAVYTHFTSKEDLFLVLFEHRIKFFIERLVNSLRKCTNRQESLEAFRKFFIGLAKDKTWAILTLEFKLYALRHPDSKERLNKAFKMSKATSDASVFMHLFGQHTGQQKADNDLALASLAPIISGLILESYFEPEILSEKGLRRMLGRIFDCFFLTPNPR
jgi:AcrR family transcriptional regulator